MSLGNPVKYEFQVNKISFSINVSYISRDILHFKKLFVAYLILKITGCSVLYLATLPGRMKPPLLENHCIRNMVMSP